MRLSQLFEDTSPVALNEMAIGLGASYTPLTDDEVKAYLRGILNKSENPKTISDAHAKKATIRAPIIHRNTIELDQDGDIDLRALKIAITTPPSKLLRQAEKMRTTSNDRVQVYSLTIPALEALIVNQPEQYSDNIDDWTFAKVNSCPGAGECQLKCYARKGSFVQFEHVSMAGMRMLNFLLNHPDKFFAKLEREIAGLAGDYFESPITMGKYQDPEQIKMIIRWHVAGDFFSPEYTERAFDLARRHPDVIFYAYTKIADVINHPNRPENFHVRMSLEAAPRQTKQVDYTQRNMSVIVPLTLYKPFMEMLINPATNRMTQKKVDGVWEYRDLAGLKDALAKQYGKYGIRSQDILTVDEFHAALPTAPEGQYCVIVRTGEADVYQKQARVVFLLEH